MSEIYKLKCQNNVEKFDLVEFDSPTNLWVKADNSNGFLGIVVDDRLDVTEEVDGQSLNISYCFVSFAGVHKAKTSRDVTLNGGSFLVENGRVYLSETLSDKYRYVLPVKEEEYTEEAFVILDGVKYLLADNLVTFVF